MEVFIIMRALDGNILWRSKFGKFLFCLCILVAILFWYHGYLAGSINIDDGLLERFGSSHIENKWEKLLPLGFEAEHYNEGANYTVLLTYNPEAENELGIDRVQILIRSALSIEEAPLRMDASYRRVGIVNAIQGLGLLGECKSQVTIETSGCLIYMADYESDGTGRNFEIVLQKILSIVE